MQYGYSYGSGSYNCEILVANDIAVTGTLSTSNAFSGIIRSATSAKVALDGGGSTPIMLISDGNVVLFNLEIRNGYVSAALACLACIVVLILVFVPPALAAPATMLGVYG